MVNAEDIWRKVIDKKEPIEGAQEIKGSSNEECNLSDYANVEEWEDEDSSDSEESEE